MDITFLKLNHLQELVIIVDAQNVSLVLLNKLQVP
jgi:hypothetical protein